jgi:hypothetical protein
MLQINGCTVMITFSRVSLNKILLNESVNAMRSQAGVSTSQLRADPANAAAMLAQNAIQLTKMGRLPDPHGRQSISTPLGVFPLYAHPDPRMFQMDSTTGYFYDPNGFYYDPNTGFYFNNTTQVWCFWCSKFSTYIPVQGSEPEMRKRLQIEERNLHAQNSDNAESSTDASAQKSEEAESEPTSKKSKKTDDPNKPKSALEIQKEMDRWAKKQAKMKKQKEEQQSAFTPVTVSIVISKLFKNLIYLLLRRFFSVITMLICVFRNQHLRVTKAPSFPEPVRQAMRERVQQIMVPMSFFDPIC